jgi:hypothetical protein
MDGLTIDLERCPDGVELVEGSWRYRTDRRETERITLADLKNPVVVEFVDAVNEKRLQRFFNRVGLIAEVPWWHPGNAKFWIHNHIHTPDPHPLVTRPDYVLDDQARFRDLLWKAGGEDPTAAMTAVNSVLDYVEGFTLKPTFRLAGSKGAPHLLLKTSTLIGFMLMETAMVVHNGARTDKCERCGKIFLTGHQTGRRAQGKYCGAGCRVAAMRARNAARD